MRRCGGAAVRRYGELEVSSGRASDDFGPGTPLSVEFNERALTRLRAGKAVEFGVEATPIDDALAAMLGMAGASSPAGHAAERDA